MDKILEEARERLASRFRRHSQIGGKGTQRRYFRRYHKPYPKVLDEEKFKKAMVKYRVRIMDDIEEINMFTEGNSVLHFG